MSSGVNFESAPLHRGVKGSGESGPGLPLNLAPSFDALGAGMQDHRYGYNVKGSSAILAAAVGWYGNENPIVANIVPSAAATANIAALAHVVSGTAMTLVSSSGAGIIVASASAPADFRSYPGSAGLLTAGLAIESLPTLALFGTGGNCTTGFYNRSTNVGRCVSISGVSGGAGGNFLVSGYDIYGYPMSQLITVGAGANTVNSTKAFKVITSVVPQFTDAHNYSVGTADIFGFGLLASYFGDVQVNWNSAAVTANTGFTAADTTSPATTTTGDVRGTYAVQSASDGTKRLFLRVTPTLGALVTNPTTGLFGVAQT